MEKLKPCPLCGGKARQINPESWVYCDAGSDCDFNAAETHWQSLPRVSDAVGDVVRQIREAVESDHIMPDNFWLVLADRLESAAVGERPIITMVCDECAQMLAFEEREGHVAVSLCPICAEAALQEGIDEGRLQSAAVGEPVREVWLQLQDHMWGQDCGVKGIYLTPDFDGVHAGPIPIHGAPEKGECEECKHREARLSDALDKLSAALARAEKAERERDAAHDAEEISAETIASLEGDVETLRAQLAERDKRIEELERMCEMYTDKVAEYAAKLLPTPPDSTRKGRIVNLTPEQSDRLSDLPPEEWDKVVPPPESTGETAYQPNEALRRARDISDKAHRCMLSDDWVASVAEYNWMTLDNLLNWAESINRRLAERDEE